MGLYKGKPRTKEEMLRNHVMNVYLGNHEKMRKQDGSVGFFGDFLGNWQPDLPGKIGSKYKVGWVFWESVLLKS